MGVEDDSAAAKSKPTIQVPPRASMEFLFTNGSFPGFSPGPMTLVSNLFPEQGQFSFSQLLAGAMASPFAAKTASLPAADSDKGEKEEEGFSEDVGGNESGGVIKRNRPTNLVVPRPQLVGLSPLFLFPPGMSPSGLLNSPGILSPLQSPFGMSHQQALAHVTAQATLSESFKQMQPGYQPPSSSDSVEVPAGHLWSMSGATLAQSTNAFHQEPESSKVESSVVSSSDKSTAPYVGGNSKPAGDGYNWRKYGQKHVKASECPRSYYKCTYYNCSVKKKVELSLDGQICGITYKGQHNHDPPQSSKRGKDSSSADRTVNSQLKPELGVLQFPSECASLQPSTLVANSRKVEETAVAADAKEDEPMAKRRSMDLGPSIPVSSLQTVSESKIVLQTRSEVDLLDDGYRWRKYGQKVVKGNPYPRSYYRCTYTGCNVRKHVERASADPKSVITTYEGKHNHDLPTGKNSHHVAADASLQQQQLQAQTRRMVSQNPSPDKDIVYGNKDRIPVTSQRKTNCSICLTPRQICKFCQHSDKDIGKNTP